MKAFRPRPITDAALISSNVPENDHPEWDKDTDYKAGDYVIVIATHTIYKCLLPHSSTDSAYPPDNVYGTLAKWYDAGKTNRHRMFDSEVASVTSQDDSIAFDIDVSMCDTFVLFNCDATHISVLLKADDGTILLDEVVDLLIDDYNDWGDIFFKEPEFRSTAYKTFSVSFGTVLSVVIYMNGGVASCGLCAIGRGRFVGALARGIKFGILDYSNKNRNDRGETYLEQGEYADVVDCHVSIENIQRSRIKNFLISVRANGIVWIVDNEDDNTDADMVTYGFYEDIQLVIENEEFSDCTLKILGLI